MLTIVVLFLWLQGTGVTDSRTRNLPQTEQQKEPEASAPSHVADRAVARCADLFETPDQRVKPRLKLAPGAPPLLNFRYFEGKMHQRFSGIDLMLDDAGH